MQFGPIDKQRRARIAVFPELMPAAVRLAEENHEAVPRMVGHQVFGRDCFLPDGVKNLFQHQVHASLVDLLDDGRIDRVPANGSAQFVIKLRRVHATGVHERTWSLTGKIEPADHDAIDGLGGNVQGTEMETTLLAGVA